MSSTNKKGRKPIYEASFKVAVAREYLTSNLGYGQLAEKYNLPGGSSVVNFVIWYKKKYGVTANRDESSDTAALPAQLHEDKPLEKVLQAANLKIAGLEMLIESAQRELGIDIVKKSGTKQSRK